MRVTVPTWSTTSGWGDGNNGFFYQAPVDGGDPSIYVPFNGVGTSSNGLPMLPQFSFIVPVDATATSIEVEACSSNYVASSGVDPACTKSFWSDTYSALPAPSAGDPPWIAESMTVDLTFANGTLSIPNSGLYPGVLTLSVTPGTGETLSDDDLQWLADHLVFFDLNGDPYTNDLFADTSEEHRSICVLSLDEATYQSPGDSNYYTKNGPTTGVLKIDAPSLQFYFYTRDALDTSAIIIGAQIIYDEQADCDRGYIGKLGTTDTATCPSGVMTSETEAGQPDHMDLAKAQSNGGLGTDRGEATLSDTDYDISRYADITPVASQGGVVTAYPTSNAAAGAQKIRSITFQASDASATCSAAVNPLAVSVSDAAYSPPNHVIDSSTGSWGKEFLNGLYFVVPSGFGNCDSSQSPFCHLTSNYAAYAPHYAGINGGFGPLNDNDISSPAGSTTNPIVGSFSLADQYELDGISTSDTNSLVWFDNCGYGYIYEECEGCAYPLGTRLTLPSPPTDYKSYEYSITNDLSEPITLGKECCASWYQENKQTEALEPPQQLDDSFGGFIAAGQTMSYGTLFSDDALVVYDGTTGNQRFKLRLNGEEPLVYGCEDPISSVNLSGSDQTFTVDIVSRGNGNVQCEMVSPCPIAMTPALDVDTGTMTCTATASTGNDGEVWIFFNTSASAAVSSRENPASARLADQ